METQSLLARLRRALRGTTPEQLAGRLRAIVGPQNKMPEESRKAIKLMEEGGKPTAQQWAALEMLIRMARPSMLSRDGELEALPELATGAFPQWDQFRATIKPHLYAIGRIDSRQSDVGGLVGTGFLVAPTVLATNRHVLDHLSRGVMELDPGDAIVFFKHEYGSGMEPPVRILRVIAFDQELDVCLLEIEAPTTAEGRAPLVFADVPAAVGDPVVAIGYPANDGRRNPAFVPAIFGDRLNVKRASPGEVIGLKKEALLHDCSTLGGNSGSPVVSITTGEVVGIHHDGTFMYANEAVDAPSARAFIQSHQQG
jgi:S1-C subfamily serine protease